MAPGCNLRRFDFVNFLNLGGIKFVQGMAIIQCKSLAPGNMAEAKIIVDHHVNDCDFGGNFMPSPFNRFIGHYLWYKNGIPIDKPISGKIEGNEDELMAVLVNYGRCIRKTTGEREKNDPRLFLAMGYWIDDVLRMDKNHTDALFEKGNMLNWLGDAHLSKEDEIYWELQEMSMYGVKNALSAFKEAIKYLDSAIKNNPSHEDAKKLKQSIEEKINRIKNSN